MTNSLTGEGCVNFARRVRAHDRFFCVIYEFASWAFLFVPENSCYIELHVQHRI